MLPTKNRSEISWQTIRRESPSGRLARNVFPDRRFAGFGSGTLTATGMESKKWWVATLPQVDEVLVYYTDRVAASPAARTFAHVTI